MQVIYEHKLSMTLIGFSTTICSGEGYVKCPEFWDKEYSQKYARLFKTMVSETPMERAILVALGKKAQNKFVFLCALVVITAIVFHVVYPNWGTF